MPAASRLACADAPPAAERDGLAGADAALSRPPGGHCTTPRSICHKDMASPVAL